MVDSCPGVNNSKLHLLPTGVLPTLDITQQSQYQKRCLLRTNSHKGAFQTLVPKEWSKQAAERSSPKLKPLSLTPPNIAVAYPMYQPIAVPSRNYDAVLRTTPVTQLRNRHVHVDLPRQH